MLGIFQDNNNKNFSLKNFNKNLQIIKEFLHKYSLNKHQIQACFDTYEAHQIPYSDFATFKNHLKQLFEKQDQQKFLIIENKPQKNNQDNKANSLAKSDLSSSQPPPQPAVKNTNNVIIKNVILLRKKKRKEFKKTIQSQLKNVENKKNLSIIKFNYYDRFKAILKDDLINSF